VLKWKKRLEPWIQGDKIDIKTSNLSNKGDLLVGFKKDNGKYPIRIALLDNEGDIVWLKSTSHSFYWISQLFLSENGNIAIVVKVYYLEVNPHIEAYNREGDRIWEHEEPDPTTIKVLSRSGKYVAVAGKLLEYGEIIREREAGDLLAMSQNDRFIVLSSTDWWGNYYISLYSIDGRMLWSVRVEGYPQSAYVTNRGEVFVLLSKGGSSVATLIKGGGAVWSRELPGDWQVALSTPEGSLFAVSSKGGTFIFDKKGNPVSHHPGIADEYSLSDNGYLLVRSPEQSPHPSYLSLLSPSGKEIYRANINNIVYTSISPNGRYFVAVTSDGLIYFFENLDLIVNERKEELIEAIDELVLGATRSLDELAYSTLKWRREVQPSDEKFMSNISISGNLAITEMFRSEGKYSYELILFNNEGNLVWKLHYDNFISNPQLSDDGNTIVVIMRDRIAAYDGRGKLKWTYDIGEKATESPRIRDYKLSRDGRYVAIATSYNTKKGHRDELVLLRDGKVRWVKSSEAIRVAISPNSTYIASATPIYKKYKSSGLEETNTLVALYTIDGAELWSTVVEGSPWDIDVSNSGEVLLSTHTNYVNNIVFFIRAGYVLWTKDHCRNAQFTRARDRIIAVREGVNVFDSEGELLWKYRGTYRYSTSDSYYVLTGGQRIVLASSEGEVLERIDLGEDVKEVAISPSGRYFAIYTSTTDEKYIYFFENKGF